MRLEISCQDRLGITQDVLDILVRHEIDLEGIEIDAVGKIYLSFPNIEFSEFQHLMPEIRKLSGVQDVKTTPFMPIERERNQLTAMLETLPDPVFSIDTKGKIIISNEAVASGLEQTSETIEGSYIGDLVKGFQFSRWLEKKSVTSQTARVKFIEQDYLADILPVFVPDSNKSQILAGAVVMLKSEMRLGQQYSVFHQSQDDCFTHFVSNSGLMKKVIREAKLIAESSENLILFGESGTGKKLLAKACHNASRFSSGPFVSVQCEQLESEVSDTSDLIKTLTQYREKSAGGTLLLEEVAALSARGQQQLLSWILAIEKDQGEQLPGGLEPFRLITTSQYDLGQKVTDGDFSESLFYKLNVLGLAIPPLRERRQDIIPLAESFIKQQASKLGRRAPKLSKSCVSFLTHYSWPGNVRQLENALQRAIVVMEGRELSKEHIQLPSGSSGSAYLTEEFEGSLDQEVKKFEKDLLRRLYPSYPSTRQLARKLGLSHTAIANKLREYGINKKSIKL